MNHYDRPIKCNRFLLSHPLGVHCVMCKLRFIICKGYTSSKVLCTSHDIATIGDALSSSSAHYADNDQQTRLYMMHDHYPKSIYITQDKSIYIKQGERERERVASLNCTTG